MAMKVAVSWSGGKDGCFACYKAAIMGFKVSHLLTFMSDSGRSSFHGLDEQLIEAQSKASGIPLLAWKTIEGTYEEEFKRALRFLKNRGVEGLVTGDIYEVPMHEEGWLDRVCRETGLKPIKPLWRTNTAQLLADFINAGFRAIVVKTKRSALGDEWLGRCINGEFLTGILKLRNVDPCGEGGEYHTFVTDGPLFQKVIKILNVRKIFNEDFGSLEIESFTLFDKKV